MLVNLIRLKGFSLRCLVKIAIFGKSQKFFDDFVVIHLQGLVVVIRDKSDQFLSRNVFAGQLFQEELLVNRPCTGRERRKTTLRSLRVLYFADSLPPFICNIKSKDPKL